jgi:aspartate/methionine/tyrosine aminotransferase
LICDEVFADYLSPESARGFHSAASQGDVLAFTLGGVSKSLGLPQMKLGWIVVTGPKPLRDEALARLEVIADTYLSVNTPAQRALPRWMAQRQAIQRQIVQRLLDNRRYLAERAADSACQLLAADGGWYAVLRVPTVRDEEAFCLDLLERDHVLVHPGYFFDFQEGGYLVLSLLLPTGVFQSGSDRLLARVAAGVS